MMAGHCIPRYKVFHKKSKMNNFVIYINESVFLLNRY